VFSIVAVDSLWICSRNCSDSHIAGRGYVSTGRKQDW